MLEEQRPSHIFNELDLYNEHARILSKMYKVEVGILRTINEMLIGFCGYIR